MNRFAWLFDIRSSDEDVRRRGQIVVILALVNCTLAFLMVPVTLTGTSPTALILLISVIIQVGVIFAARAGMVSLGGAIIAIVTALGILAGIMIDPARYLAPFFLVLPVLIAGLTLRPWQVWLVALACIGGEIAAVGLLPVDPLESTLRLQVTASTSLLVLTAAALSFVAARSNSAFLLNLIRSRAETEHARRALELVNNVLEQRIDERTTALEVALAVQQERSHELEESLETQRRLYETILTIAAPILPIRDDVLVVPLIGQIDAQRAAHLTNQLLLAAQHAHARIVFLDVTGMALVDAQVAQALVQSAQALRLLGAQTVLVGIRPEVAQTLVSLGADLSMLQTAATLQAGLQAV